MSEMQNFNMISFRFSIDEGRIKKLAKLLQEINHSCKANSKENVSRCKSNYIKLELNI